MVGTSSKSGEPEKIDPDLVLEPAQSVKDLAEIQEGWFVTRYASQSHLTGFCSDEKTLEAPQAASQTEELQIKIRTESPKCSDKFRKTLRLSSKQIVSSP